ncbi:MAG: protein kinase [Myxococcota bacterium]
MGQGLRNSSVPPPPVSHQAGDPLAVRIPPSPRVPIGVSPIPEIELEWEDDAAEDEARVSPVPSLAPSLPPPIGRVGRFEILGRVAIGGMAEIFLATQHGEADTDRLLVIKFVRTSLGDDPQLADLFEREARVVMRLSHPNICHVYEVGKAGGRHYIAMEWIHGVTLRDLYKRAQAENAVLPIPIVVKVMAQVAEALDFAHRARDRRGKPLGIVHRDVSPANVMVRYDGVVKLVDFGVAKEDSSVTQSGTIKGKFAYMSPEQAQGRSLDGRSDVFSAGVVLYELLTGRRAYRQTSQFETLRAIVEKELPPPSESNPRVPPRLDAIVRRCMAKDPHKRYLSAAALQEDLLAFLTEERQVVNAARIARLMHTFYGDQRGTPELDRSADAAVGVIGIESLPPAPGVSTLPVPAPGGRSTKMLAMVAAAVVVLVVAGLAVILASGPSDTDLATETSGTTPASEPEPTPVEATGPVVAEARELVVESQSDESPSEAPEEVAAPEEATPEAAAPERALERETVTEAERAEAERERAAARERRNRRREEASGTMMRSRFVTSPF